MVLAMLCVASGYILCLPYIEFLIAKQEYIDTTSLPGPEQVSNRSSSLNMVRLSEIQITKQIFKHHLTLSEHDLQFVGTTSTERYFDMTCTSVPSSIIRVKRSAT